MKKYNVKKFLKIYIQERGLFKEEKSRMISSEAICKTNAENKTHCFTKLKILCEIWWNKKFWKTRDSWNVKTLLQLD